MPEMTRMERMSAVLAGEQPDRPPVSFWYHFPSNQARGQAAIDAHLDHLHKFDLDFLKVMNDFGYPTKGPIQRAADLRELPVLRGDEGCFVEQLELIRSLARELSGRTRMCTTLFNAWGVLRRIVTPRVSDRHAPPELGGGPASADLRLSELLSEDRSAVGAALDIISSSLAHFGKRCIEAGADGVFLSVRDDWVNTESNGLGTYDELVRSGDKKLLDAVSGARFNMLHVCGIPKDFDSFAQYRVAVINWADRAGGPAIGDVANRIAPVVCAGVDNLTTLPSGCPEDVQREVEDALRQAGSRPMIISAGCTFDPDTVPDANLHAMVQAVR